MPEYIKQGYIYVQYGTVRNGMWGVKIWNRRPMHFDRNVERDHPHWERLQCPDTMHRIRFESDGSIIITRDRMRKRIENIIAKGAGYDTSVERRIYNKLCKFACVAPKIFQFYNFTIKSIQFPWDAGLIKQKTVAG